MHILQVARSFSNGGAATGAANLYRSLVSAGAQVSCVAADETIRRSPLRVARTAERIIERSLFDANTHCIKVAPSSLSIKDLVQLKKPDILQLCDVSANTLNLKDLLLLDIPIVHRMSDTWPYCGPKHYNIDASAGRMARKLFLRPELTELVASRIQLVAPSNWLVEQFEAGGVDPRRIEVIKNAVSKAYKGTAARGRCVKDQGVVTLGFVAKDVLEPRKGFASLVGTLERIAASDSSTAGREISFELNVYGRIKNRNRIVSSNFPIHYKYWSEKEQIYDDIEILICPSTFDTSPNVVPEALARAIPVIVNQSCGARDYVDDGENGFCIDITAADRKPDEALVAENLSRGIKAIIASYKSFSHSAILSAESELSYEKIGGDYLRLYERLLNPRHGKSGQQRSSLESEMSAL